MPELPEVETYKRYLDMTSLNQVISNVIIIDNRVLGSEEKYFKKELKGKKFENSTRHGKYLIVNLNPKYLILHFGMSGDLEYFSSEDPKPAYSKIIFEFNNGNSLAYISRRMFGRLYISDDINSFLIKKKLGPDAYKMDLDEFDKSLIRRTTNAKTALMNQSIIAGIGNIYSDEILFQSKINPKMKIDQIYQNKILLRTLFDKIKSVLSYGIEKKGVLNTYSKDFLIPYRKKEAICPICKTIIERYDIIGRRGFYCPKCQK